MFTNIKILESAPCEKDNFPMLHSLSLLTPFYIVDSISYLQWLIISSQNQNKSLIRIILGVSVGNVQLCFHFNNCQLVSLIGQKLTLYCKFRN